MTRMLSSKEVDVIKKDLDEWWKNLDFNTKNNIKHLLQPFIEQYEKEHFCYNKGEHLLVAVRWVHNVDTNEEVPVVYCNRGCGFRIENDKELWLKLIKENHVSKSYL